VAENLNHQIFRVHRAHPAAIRAHELQHGRPYQQLDMVSARPSTARMSWSCASTTLTGGRSIPPTPPRPGRGTWPRRGEAATQASPTTSRS
jgi:hypothetical protein